MRFPKIGRYLSTDDGLHPVVAKALEIQALAALCTEFLPPELACEAQAANLKGGTLVILAAHSAAAAKLRLMSESLSKFLLKQGAEVNSVSVKVQPTRSRKKDVASHKKTQISPAALSELSALHARLRDSPARSALAKILERHSVKPATSSPADARKGKVAGSDRRRKAST
ncbi:MAG: DciA family protein [Burkholderiales bacterium]